MKKIEWIWKGFGLEVDPKYSCAVYFRWGYLRVDTFRRVTEPGWSSGRRHEKHLRIPLTKKWQVDLSLGGKDYLTLVRGPKYLRSLDWIIDEFNASFNDLAIASLKYHLDFSICDNEDRRELYEDLIARLGEDPPELTDEEMAVLRPPGWTFEDDFEHVDGRIFMKESTPDEKAVYAAYRQREEEYHERIQQARHAFVDALPGLWS